jgi:hypothetical protein
MPTIPELLRDHVSLDIECVDRAYLNGYVPTLQTSGALGVRAAKPQWTWVRHGGNPEANQTGCPTETSGMTARKVSC